MRNRSVYSWVAAAWALLALGIATCLSPFGGHTAQDLLQALRDYAQGPAAPLVVALVYVAAGFLLVPVTLLIAVTGLAYGPVEGALYALLGAAASAASAYAVGRQLSAGLLRRYAGPRITAIRKQLKARGLLAIVALRVVPSGPFTVINLVAGASGITFRDFIAGTVLGMAPGIAVTVGLVHGLHAAWQAPDAATVALALVGIAAAVAFAYGARRLLRQRRGRGGNKAAIK